MQGTGSYNLESKDYAIDLTGRNFRLTSLELPDGSPVRASVNLEVRGKGNIDDPSGTVSLSAADVQYRDQNFGALTLQANIANQRADILAAAPQFNLTAKANAGLQEPNPVTFEVTADRMDLATLPMKLQLPVAGTVTATLRGAGDLKNYEQGQASVEVAKLQITYKGQPAVTEGPLIASYQDRMLTIGRAFIVAGDSRVSVDGKLPLDDAAGTGAIHIASTLNLASLRPYLSAMPPETTLAGAASINGTVTGTLKKIDPNVTITLDQGSVSGAGFDSPLSNLTLRAQIRDGALELEKASGEWGPGKFQASAVIPLALLPADLPVELPRRQGPAQLTAELSQIDISALPGVPKDVTGAVSARIEAQAARPDVEAITATLTFPTLRVGLGTYSLEQTGISTVSVANAAARIEQLQLTGPQTDIKVTGTAGLLGAHPLDLHLAGSLDASLAGAFTRGRASPRGNPTGGHGHRHPGESAGARLRSTHRRTDQPPKPPARPREFERANRSRRRPRHPFAPGWQLERGHALRQRVDRICRRPASQYQSELESRRSLFEFPGRPQDPFQYQPQRAATRPATWYSAAMLSFWKAASRTISVSTAASLPPSPHHAAWSSPKIPIPC